MKYILNTGRYAIAFTIMKNEREVKIALDRRRLFLDTGNVATTGITPVEEADIAELKKQKRFNDTMYDFPGGSDGKASAYNVEYLGSIPGLGRSSGEGSGNPLQYSCLENPMDGGAW